MTEKEMLDYLKRIVKTTSELSDAVASMAVDFRAEVLEQNEGYKVSWSEKAKKGLDQ